MIGTSLFAVALLPSFWRVLPRFTPVVSLHIYLFPTHVHVIKYLNVPDEARLALMEDGCRTSPRLSAQLTCGQRKSGMTQA